MPQRTSGEIFDVVAKLWAQLFAPKPVNINDDFFKLGGDPWMATELFAKLEQEFGTPLSPLLIFRASTISSLVKLLDSSPAPSIPSVMKLKDGVGDLPVFLIHGLGGNVMEFFHLLHFLRFSRAVYGLQARGTDGIEPPCKSIEEMARHHYDNIKRIQPRGPYLLVGYSLGGLVAWEIARMLVTHGEEVAMLLMIDSYPSMSLVSKIERLRIYSRKARALITNSVRPSQKTFASPGHQARAQGNPWPKISLPPTAASAEVRRCSTQAWQNYRPTPYSGDVIFLRSAVPSDYPEDPAKLWTPHARRFKIEDVPGTHATLLTTHCQDLANAISRHVNGAK